jgi:hypothetical protein
MPEPQDIAALRETWEAILTADGWEDIDHEALLGQAAGGIAWSLLEQTMDTGDRQPSVEVYQAADATAQRLLALLSEVERGRALRAAVEMVEDKVCDCLMAERHGAYDGRGVRSHLEQLLDEVRNLLAAHVPSPLLDGGAGEGDR